jgi:hypothetical protein
VEWKAYAEEVRELLELEGYPAAVTHSIDGSASLGRVKALFR